PAAAAPAARVEAFYRDLAAIVGGHAGRGLPVAAATRTSEELVAAVAAGAGPLRACLQRCDAVKFAAARPDPAAHAAAHAAAVQFVQTEEA
ncbi:MAG: hypothetical protein KF830_11440, partial [Planctomycetes bacterium]|nr:hypothetical protein [Planctomycetota bacterium]